jgi:F-type H+-transporting ATPase subunit c
MDLSFGIGFALPIALGIAALGGGLGLGKAVEGAMNAIGRNPESAGKLFMPFVIGCALIEALTIYALVVFFSGQEALTATINAAQAVGTATGGG